MHTIRLLETNEDDKDVPSESVFMPYTCELSSGSDFDDNLEFAESLRNPTTGEKNYTSFNLLIRFNAFIFSAPCLHVVYSIFLSVMYLYRSINPTSDISVIPGTVERNCDYGEYILFTAFYPTSIHFYTVQY